MSVYCGSTRTYLISNDEADIPEFVLIYCNNFVCVCVYMYICIVICFTG